MKRIIIKLNNITLSYDKNKDIIKNLSYEFNGPGLYIIKGRNGSGKSTLLKAMLNQIKLNGGEISATSIPYGIIEDACGYSNLSVKDQLDYLAKNEIDKELYDSLLIDEHKNKTFNKISLGTKQKLMVLNVFSSDNDILLFDEPTIALDQESLDIFIEKVNKEKENKLIIIATHDYYFINKLNPSEILLLNNKLEKVESNNKILVNVTVRNNKFNEYLENNNILYSINNNDYTIEVTDEELDGILKLRKEYEILNISFVI